ncbi:hypothetical protein DAPPUDRAFT_233757 [Daphnia pulex]|uniref:Uncharacterized protein n=1 Tax=Daphnia pulex TaxID=6669 RepID=E9FVM6_DAPPU|nr:hypothetical protein DAPPUDRAFT_233757 [Daphnia pulex]|eukprot:EFX88580.1 hypothetical protein DAPPUDRAFT_233757 [Daphnia pulex]
MIYYEEEQRPYRLYVMADYIRSVQVSRKKKKRKYYIREKGNEYQGEAGYNRSGCEPKAFKDELSLSDLHLKMENKNRRK